jgi:uncharacterized membrane-anchored protein YitT (DUF2179 family)
MGSGVTGGRRLTAQLLAGVLALAWGYLFYGLQDFLSVLIEGESFAAHYLLESGWGLFFLVLVAVPLVVLAARPGTATAVRQVVACAVALACGAVLGTEWWQLLVASALAATGLLLAWLAGARVTWPVGRPAPVTAVLALVAVVPAAPYAWRTARGTTDAEFTWGIDHYPIQASYAIALVLVALLAAFAAAEHHWSRWLPALTVGFSAAWLGVESVVYPHRLASFGTTWGWLAVAWAVALVVATAVEGADSA